MADKVTKSEAEWRERLSPDQYKVTREKGTELPFYGKYHDCKDKGVYRCVCCGSDLFSSDAKFDSGSGSGWRRSNGATRLFRASWRAHPY